jgi:hypothetical protein
MHAFSHPDAMTTATISTTHSSNGTAPSAPAYEPTLLPAEVIDHLDVHFAGKDEAQAIAELAANARERQPVGSLLVGTVDGKLLAAGSLANGEVVSDPTPSGAAAAAVVRYRLAELGRRGRTARKAGTPS